MSEDVEIFKDGFQKKPSFGGKDTFTTDLKVFVDKYKGSKYKPFLYFMLDSLIIMEHARENIENDLTDPELNSFLQEIKEKPNR